MLFATGMGGRNFPYDSITQMPAGDFWARPSSLGLSTEDAQRVAAMGPHGVESEIQTRALLSVRRAAFALRAADPGVAYHGKPS